MPTAKFPKKASKTVTPKEILLEEEIITGSDYSSSTSMIPEFLHSKKMYIILLVIGVLILLYYKKSWFVAATVNGMPISNFEVMNKMNAQFRSQTLNQIVNEKIIMDAAQKNNVVVKKADIDQKMAELEKNVGGAETLDGLLAQQGQTRDGLRNQLKIQLIIEKLYSKDATISAQEIEQFIAQNKDQLKASDSAGQQQEAGEALKQQKLSQIFQEKFQQLKQAAKVNIF